MDMRLSDLFDQRAHPAYGAGRESYFIPAPALFDDYDDLEDLDEDDDLFDDDDFIEGFPESKAQAAAPVAMAVAAPSEPVMQKVVVAASKAPQEDEAPRMPPSGGRVKEGDLLVMAKGLNKQYKQGGNVLNILNNVDMRICAGEITALVGPSGSGKSSLLHILGLLDSATSGQIIMGGEDIARISDGARTKLRSSHIGFIYQFHHLLPEFSAVENVALPLVIAGVGMKEAQAKAMVLLEQLGLGHRVKHRPAELSGGEQQRVAIARALVNDPYLLFADEPTGNLDPETSGEVFDLLLSVVRNRGIGALVATHNMELANQMDRILEVKSGRILSY